LLLALAFRAGLCELSLASSSVGTSENAWALHKTPLRRLTTLRFLCISHTGCQTPSAPGTRQKWRLDERDAAALRALPRLASLTLRAASLSALHCDALPSTLTALHIEGCGAWHADSNAAERALSCCTPRWVPVGTPNAVVSILLACAAAALAGAEAVAAARAAAEAAAAGSAVARLVDSWLRLLLWLPCVFMEYNPFMEYNSLRRGPRVLYKEVRWHASQLPARRIAAAAAAAAPGLRTLGFVGSNAPFVLMHGMHAAGLAIARLELRAVGCIDPAMLPIALRGLRALVMEDCAGPGGAEELAAAAEAMQPHLRELRVVAWSRRQGLAGLGKRVGAAELQLLSDRFTTIC
jgi:hypothetical protein